MAKRTSIKPPRSKPPVEPPAENISTQPTRRKRTSTTARRPVPAEQPAPESGRQTSSADSLHILMVTPEARPFAKTGGLADVCGALPLALARLGHHVTVVLPRYRGIEPGTGVRDIRVPLGVHDYRVRFSERPMGEGVTAVLVDAPDLYDRDGLYGDARGDYRDNAFRFAVLSRAALEYARTAPRPVSVMHAHDWQAGLVPVYARTLLANDAVISRIPIVVTIHNLAFQGLFEAAELPWLGLSVDLFRPDRLEFWGRASALKGGVQFADTITTVSPTYAREILTPEYGFGFEGILASRARDLVGILNGIDTDAWNPETDPHLPEHFSPASPEGKRDVKRALLSAAGLRDDKAGLRRPAIGMVSRLTHQKGFDLIAKAMPELLAIDAAWIMLGNGDRSYEEFWSALARRQPGRVAAHIGFDERLAHLIEGGADLFLMPSRYEPCGLNQMYSLRYGTIPIVFATGGLDDTVIDADADARAGTGFKFVQYAPDALVDAVGRALKAFAN
ncbi:MAG TPA: glycogen synthase GlgA, partial [Vicinamibacterales bacterium]